MKNKRAPKRVCSIIGLALLCLVGVWLCGSLGLSALHASLWPESYNNIWFIWLRNDIPLYLMGAPLFLLILRLVPNGEETPKAKQTIRFGVGTFFMVLIFCFGVAYTVNMIMVMITLIVSPTQILESIPTASSMLTEISMGGALPSLIFGVIVPAFGEEYLLRWVLRKKMRGASDASYIFVSALSFSLMHANIMQMPYTFVLGAVFAWVFAYTRNIWLPILLHGAFNAVGILLVPALMDAPMALVVFGLFALLAIPAAIVLFFVFKRRVIATLQPPTEQGWPYRAPRWLPMFLYKKYATEQARAAQQAYSYGAPPQQMPPYGYGYAPPHAYYAPPQVYIAPTQQNAADIFGVFYPYIQPYWYLPKAYAKAMGMRKPKGSFGVCIGNVGMILYMVFTGILTLGMLYLSMGFV